MCGGQSSHVASLWFAGECLDRPVSVILDSGRRYPTSPVAMAGKDSSNIARIAGGFEEESE